MLEEVPYSLRGLSPDRGVPVDKAAGRCDLEVPVPPTTYSELRRR